MYRLSGDQAGNTFQPDSSVIFSMPLPSGLTTKICHEPSSCRPEKSSCLPSGDQAGNTQPPAFFAITSCEFEPSAFISHSRNSPSVRVQVKAISEPSGETAGSLSH